VVWAWHALRGLLRGDPRDAVEAARMAFALADATAKARMPDSRDFVQVRWLLGASFVALAETETGETAARLLVDAEAQLGRALERCRRIDLVELEPDILLSQARWHRARGDATEARRHAEEALSIADRCEYRLAQADAHNLLARLALESGDGERALEHAESGRDRAWCDGPPHCYKAALDQAEALLERL
jgi:hypothetical protein